MTRQSNSSEDVVMADADQFVRLLVRHQNDLLHYITPLVGSIIDAQDVLQETATALWKKFDQFDSTKPFLPWAKKFANYEVLMFHRKRKTYTFLSDELIERLSQQQEERPSDHQEQMRAALQRCLQSLSDEDRHLLRARYEEPDFNVGQLAEQWGRSANVLYKTLGKVRQRLLDCIRGRIASEQAPL